MKILKLVSDLSGISLEQLTDKHYLDLEGHSEVSFNLKSKDFYIIGCLV